MNPVASVGSDTDADRDRDTMSMSAPKLYSQLVSFSKEGPNKICCDCFCSGLYHYSTLSETDMPGEPMKRVWISTNLGVFLCIHCAGVHRSLGTHLRYHSKVYCWARPNLSLQQYTIARARRLEWSHRHHARATYRKQSGQRMLVSA